MGIDILKSDNQAIIDFVQKMEDIYDSMSADEGLIHLYYSEEYLLLRNKAGLKDVT